MQDIKVIYGGSATRTLRYATSKPVVITGDDRSVNLVFEIPSEYDTWTKMVEFDVQIKDDDGTLIYPAYELDSNDTLAIPYVIAYNGAGKTVTFNLILSNGDEEAPVAEVSKGLTFDVTNAVDFIQSTIQFDPIDFLKSISKIVYSGGESIGESYTAPKLTITTYKGVVTEYTLDDFSVMNKAIQTEGERAESSESEISSALDSETARAETAESEIKVNLSDEVTRATGVEASLESKITSEKSRAQNSEAYIQSQLATEVSRAQASESDLSIRINNETSRATSAESGLSSAITSEADRAKGAESSNATNIIAEKNRAVSAESNLDSKISTETSRAVSAEKAVAESVAVEKERATRVESEILSEVQEETDRAIEAEVDLEGKIDTASNTTAITSAPVTGTASMLFGAVGEKQTPKADTKIWVDFSDDSLVVPGGIVGNASSASALKEGVVLTKAQGGTGYSEFDTTPVADSLKAVTSNGIYQADKTISDNLATEVSERKSSDVAINSSISTLQKDVDVLKGRNARYLIDISSEDPTEAELTKAFQEKSGLTTPIDGTILESSVTNIEWMWFSTEAEGKRWVNRGVTSVSRATSDTYGIVQGNEVDGGVVYDTAGLGTVQGWEELSAKATSASASVDGIKSDLSAEITRAKSAESDNAYNLTTEVNRAKDAETSLSIRVSDETSRASGVESTLAESITSEASRAKDKETTIATALSNEITRATDSEALNAKAISDETSRATGVESALSTKLSDEVTRATNAETDNYNAIVAETDARTEQTTKLTADLSAETTRATNAENSNNSLISTETTRATNAEAVLQTNIDTEASRAKEEERDIKSDMLEKEETLSKGINELEVSVTKITNGTTVVGKATSDASGNVIVDTYATQTALSNVSQVADSAQTDASTALSEIDGISVKVEDIIDGDEIVGKAKADANGNVIADTYATKASLNKVIDGTTPVAKATALVTMDTTPKEGSTNAVTSDGIYKAIKGGAITIDPATNTAYGSIKGNDVNGGIVFDTAGLGTMKGYDGLVSDISSNKTDIATIKSTYATVSALETTNANVTKAQNDATAGISKGDTAQETANNAMTRADSAQTTANNAQTRADSAQSTANTASSTANGIINGTNVAKLAKCDADGNTITTTYATVTALSTTNANVSTALTNANTAKSMSTSNQTEINNLKNGTTAIAKATTAETANALSEKVNLEGFQFDGTESPARVITVNSNSSILTASLDNFVYSNGARIAVFNNTSYNITFVKFTINSTTCSVIERTGVDGTFTNSALVGTKQFAQFMYDSANSRWCSLTPRYTVTSTAQAVTLTQDSATAEDAYVAFSKSQSGESCALETNTLKYKPSTDTLTVSKVAGNLNGTADKATADADGNVITDTYATISGVTGGTTVAGKATKLNTARSLRVNFETDYTQYFDGSANANNIGVTGVLGVANGGTGVDALSTVPTSESSAPITSGAVYDVWGDNATPTNYIEAPSDLLSINTAHLTEGTFEGASNMRTAYVATEDATTLSNSPVSSGAFYAVREVFVMPNHDDPSRNKVTVRLTENYPVHGRIWINTYNPDDSGGTGDWTGWMCHSPTTPTHIASAHSWELCSYLTIVTQHTAYRLDAKHIHIDMSMTVPKSNNTGDYGVIRVNALDASLINSGLMKSNESIADFNGVWGIDYRDDTGFTSNMYLMQWSPVAVAVLNTSSGQFEIQLQRYTSQQSGTRGAWSLAELAGNGNSATFHIIGIATLN